MKAFIDMCEPHRAVTWLGAFGASSAKPLELYTSMCAKLFRTCVGSRSDAFAELSDSRAQPIFVKTRRLNAGVSTGWSAEGWFTGTTNQEESETYPWPFALAVAEIVKSAISPGHLHTLEDTLRLLESMGDEELD